MIVSGQINGKVGWAMLVGIAQTKKLGMPTQNTVKDMKLNLPLGWMYEELNVAYS